ncbi:hypothetical protein BAUCODRAFT_281550 [Baudoinia panamericana UAMH 10762]|uniref:Uncharacterized protein n=1 Tax=Baudoinia panamericana (strain UAMH 10762) TaxID=717646 RepID=M2MLD7_BAUPA|nr:uncharacterized protein BAUCODRAFT_281550 [Baudoinia panamericana UAMH 10762]EMC92198.1 hypothetical protein BAUCODRAFT_281550 [Baudoinia panamericana UAMH 10762]
MYLQRTIVCPNLGDQSGLTQGLRLFYLFLLLPSVILGVERKLTSNLLDPTCPDPTILHFRSLSAPNGGHDSALPPDTSGRPPHSSHESCWPYVTTPAPAIIRPAQLPYVLAPYSPHLTRVRLGILTLWASQNVEATVRRLDDPTLALGILLHSHFPHRPSCTVSSARTATRLLHHSAARALPFVSAFFRHRSGLLQFAWLGRT